MDAVLPVTSDLWLPLRRSGAETDLCACRRGALREGGSVMMGAETSKFPPSPKAEWALLGRAPAKARRGPQTAKKPRANTGRKTRLARGAGPPPMNRRCAVSTP